MNKIIFIAGVSGSGKSTIGKLLSQKIKIPFFDADDFHSKENKEKMKAGFPLDDNDRQKWLHDLNKLGVEESKSQGAVIACSALKKKYRAILATDIPQPIFILLYGSYKIIFERIKQRKDHFMPAQLLQSQFKDLEIADDAFVIDVNNNAEKIVEAIQDYLFRKEKP